MLNHSHFSIKKQIYDRITYLGTASKAELLDYFSITSSSMTRILEDMLVQKRIVVSGLGTSTGGRKPILFQTNPDYGYLLGLEISRISSSLGLFDLHLNPLSSVRWEMDRSLTPELLVKLVINETNKMLGDHHIAQEKILGMGIGAVGPLDPKKGIILQPEHFPSADWNNVPICKLLEKGLKIPTKLDNGANTALLAEHWALRNEACEHMLYVHAGVSIRSSIMSEGQILRGAADTEGAIGQMIIQTGGRRLRDKGNYGSLEAYVSVPSLEERAQSQLKIGRESSLSNIAPECVTFSSLVKALEQKDPLVRELFTETASYLGIGIANLINTVHPEYVILGGALINADPIVYDTATQIAKKNIYHYPHYNPIFSTGVYGEDGVVTGAALQILQNWDK
ncbi:ROK family protein [Paenibacillus terrae]|uniref:ROK family protein n=1 Tax=Paenibacillus terrae TaxID=159743 RepID=UPI0011EB3E4B|nr:ROK family protein [Paenibacillus terrae]